MRSKYEKIIIQSDDLGITKGVTDGIIAGIENGIIKCTGLFANMESSEYAANRIKNYDVCVGQDINIVAGKPCANPKDIGSLVDENGWFLTSAKSKEIDKTFDSNDHLVYEECLIEVEAQLNRFYELMGRYPEYLHGHSYSTPTLELAIDSISEKYNIPTTRYLKKQYNLQRPIKDWNKKPFSLEDQLNANQLEAIMQEDYLKAEYGWIVFHCGYVDAEIFDVSSYTLIRPMDLKAATSKKLKKWLNDNEIEVISYRDLKK